MRCVREQQGATRGRISGERNLCKIRDCPNDTSEKKPYCLEHLDRLPYVMRLEAELKAKEKEIAKAGTKNGWRHVKSNGLVCQEIVELLKNKGAMSPAQLAKSIEIKISSVTNYLTHLEKKKTLKVLTLGSRRGTSRKVVALT